MVFVAALKVRTTTEYCYTDRADKSSSHLRRLPRHLNLLLHLQSSYATILPSQFTISGSNIGVEVPRAIPFACADARTGVTTFRTLLWLLPAHASFCSNGLACSLSGEHLLVSQIIWWEREILSQMSWSAKNLSCKSFCHQDSCVQMYNTTLQNYITCYLNRSP